MGRPRRLTLDQVLTTALTLIDDVGLDGLTMDQLADRLGVGTSTVYGYVSTKQDLLDALIDHIVGGVDVALIDPHDWRLAAETFMGGFRSLLLRHPNLATRWTTRELTTPHAVDGVRHLLESMVDGGLSVSAAVAGYFALHAYTIGFVLWELPRLHPHPQPEYGRRLRGAAAAGGWRTDLMLGLPAYVESASPDEQFTSGLRLVIAGVAAQAGGERP